MTIMLLNCFPTGTFQANCYILGTEVGGKGIIIDPGDDPKEILDHVRKLGLTVEYMLLTHGHPDHCGALKHLKENTHTRIAIHNADVKLLQDRAMSFFLGLGYHRPPEPDVLLNDGDEIRVEDLTLKVLSTPGHTPGSICLLGNGFVFSGDTLFNSSIGRTDLPGGSSQDIIQSIERKLLTLPDDIIVYPGHGPATTIGAERRGNPFLNC